MRCCKNELDRAGRPRGCAELPAVRRLRAPVVVTVDNLDRAECVGALWPVIPDARALRGQRRGREEHIDADNACVTRRSCSSSSRSTARRAVALYRCAYPLFQQSYEELGYPQGIQRPAGAGHRPPAAHAGADRAAGAHADARSRGRTPRRGPGCTTRSPTRRWKQRSAGQKLLMRMGTVNERRLKAKLDELRAQLVAKSPPETQHRRARPRRRC